MTKVTIFRRVGYVETTVSGEVDTDDQITNLIYILNRAEAEAMKENND